VKKATRKKGSSTKDSGKGEKEKRKGKLGVCFFAWKFIHTGKRPDLLGEGIESENKNSCRTQTLLSSLKAGRGGSSKKLRGEIRSHLLRPEFVVGAIL